MTFRKVIHGYTLKDGDYNDNGIWVEGVKEPFVIKGSIQPLNTNEQAQYATLTAEGFLQSSIMKVYTASKLNPPKHAEGSDEGGEGDYILYSGRVWRVVACSQFQSDVIPHYRAIIQEVRTSEAYGE